MRRRELLTLPLTLHLLQAQAPEQSLFNGRDLTGWAIQSAPETAFFVDNSELCIHPGSGFPAWLRTDKKYENFDLSLEVLIRGWANSGIYFAAPDHGLPMYCGYKINIFQNNEGGAKTTSMGSIFPVVAPSKIAVQNGWNKMRIRFDYPRLEVWINDQQVQNLDITTVPELRWRLRRGYLGIESQGHPLRFRNLTIRELPSKDPSIALYDKPADFANWTPIGDGDQAAKWERIGNILRADGLGYLATNEKYKDFYLEMYVRQSRVSNGGIYFRVAGDNPSRSEHYEIQLYDQETANYATGSLYGIERARYPRVKAEEWYLFQMAAQGKRCMVRINGETIIDNDKLEREVAGPIMLQAHDRIRWIEYKSIRLTRL